MTLEELRQIAVDAIHTSQTQSTERTERLATIAVGEALLAGITPAQIASVAQMRQVYVVPYIADQRARRAALNAARWDAQRHTDYVLEQIKFEALRQVGLEVPKSTVAKGLGISRPTLDSWIEKA